MLVAVMGRCLDEMAGYMANQDNDVNTVIHNKNHVYTYTIGLDIDLQILEDTADAGAPPYAEPGESGYYIASDSLGLEAAFHRILASIQSVSSDTFVAPAVTVNSFNRLRHREDVYFAIFKPEDSPRWNGNLKKYKVTSEAEIRDAEGENAIDNLTGFFRSDAISFWSDEEDGSIVEKGGFAGEFTTTEIPRSLYANVNASSANVVSLTTVDKDLQDSIDLFTSLAPNMGEAGSDSTELDASRDLIAGWTLGADVATELGDDPNAANKFVSETLHGTPFVLNFSSIPNSPKDIIFMTTNQGLLHGINVGDPDEANDEPEGGIENWAYIPDPELFKNLGAYFYDEDGDDHQYGLDGQLSFLVERNASLEITKAQLFFGQRRGGYKYFAIDVENADLHDTGELPVKKLWTINGGAVGGEFENMGQTWAKPVITKIKYCDDDDCDIKNVAILAGGYDPDEYDKQLVDTDNDSVPDTEVVPTINNVTNAAGNAIYIVDIDETESDGVTPKLLWKAYGGASQETNNNRDFYSSDMDHSFPSAPFTVDVTGDGAADTMFAMDIAGRLWRFDFRAHENDDTDIQELDNTEDVAGGIIADLRESGKNRFFYNSPDISVTPSYEDTPARFNIVAGSGYRAHPLTEENNSNKIYIVYDENIIEPNYGSDTTSDGDKLVSYEYAGTGTNTEIIEHNDLANINSTDLKDEEFGVYVNLDGSVKEKMLNPTVTQDFKVLATSYTPENLLTNVEEGICNAGTGQSKLYTIDLLTGGTDVLQLQRAGISAQPVILYIIEDDCPGGEDCDGGDDSGDDSGGHDGGGSDGGSGDDDDEQCDPTIEDCSDPCLNEGLEIKPVVIVGTEPIAGEDLGLSNVCRNPVSTVRWWEENREN